jgi:threonine dehydratase
MPFGAPLPKLVATQTYGAEVQMVGTTIDEALVAAQEFASRTGAILIHPFDHVDIVAGQGTVGLEILEQAPDVRTVVVCTGGGGLLAGIGVAVKALRPDVRVIGVQAEGAAAYPPSLAKGEPVALAGMSTMADGIAVGRPGDIPFAIVSRLVDQIRTVDEEALARAQLICLERGKLLVEPAGAAGVAAILDDPTAFEPPVVVVLSGGNVDPLLLLRVIRHGLAAAGRYASLRLKISDRPGSLARLLHELAEADANIIEVEHARIDPRLSVDEVEVEVQIETRGKAHLDEVLARLAASGYQHVVLE